MDDYGPACRECYSDDCPGCKPGQSTVGQPCGFGCGGVVTDPETDVCDSCERAAAKEAKPELSHCNGDNYGAACGNYTWHKPHDFTTTTHDDKTGA